MQIGFAVPVSGPWATPENQVEVAKRAEALGYRTLWTFQRLLYPADAADQRWIPSYRGVADPLVTLAYVSAVTERARLGVGVLNLPWYSPILLAKQLNSVDIVSRGRLDVGLGLGWAPEEYAATGVPMTGRGARAEEFLQCLHALWGDGSGGPVAFDGAHWSVPPAYVDPPPVQRPHPPVILGGFAPAALERTGRLADGWMSSSRADLTRIGDSVKVVREAAERAGRDPDALRFICRGVIRLRSAPGAADRAPLTGTVDEIHGDFEDLAAQGMTELFCDPNFDAEVGGPDVPPAEAMARSGELLEALAPGR